MVNSQLVGITPQNTPEVSKHAPTRRLNKRQKDFIHNWIDFNSPTFGNTYQSAILAGFAPKAAKQITSNYRDLEWVKEAKGYMDNYSPMHIISAFQHEALHAKQSRDRQSALDRLAKIKGMYIERSQSEVSVTFTNSVPRPHIDSTTE